MLYQLETKIKLTLEHEPGWTTSKHKECKIQLNIPSNFDANQYFDKEGNLTANGAKSQTIVMLSGISANIHASHQAGVWDSAEHLRYIINELEKQFVQVANVDVTEYGNKM